MADTGILATTAQIQALVGANASTTYNAEAYTNIYVAYAEGLINGATQYNWNDNYGTLNADVKGYLALCAASLAAMMVVQADMSGYYGNEGLNKLNFLSNMHSKTLEILKLEATKNFVKAA